MSFRVTIYHEFSKDVEDLWRRIETISDCYIFQAYDWNALWYDCIGKKSSDIIPCIAVIFESDEPVALFPFGIRRVWGIKILEFMGGDQSDYLSPLFNNNKIAQDSFKFLWELVEAALPKYDVFIFTKMPGSFNERPNLSLEIWPCRFSNEAFSATLPDSWEDMETRLSNKLRNDSKRQFRRLSERGVIKFIIAETEESYNYFLKTMFDQKRKRYIETGVRDVLEDQNVRDFYLLARTHIQTNCSVQMSALLCDDELIATHWGLVKQSRYYWLMPSYSSGEMARYSPGRILQEKVMQWAIENKLKLFDFTIGAEEYKKVWSDQKLVLFEYVGKKTIAGSLFLALYKLKYALKNHPKSRKLVIRLVRITRRLGLS